MKKLLIEDANRLYNNPTEYAEICEKIETVRYKTFAISEADFNTLVFMEPNTEVWAGKPALVDILAPKGKPRTLGDVVARILTAYPYQNALKLFKQLSEDEPWFEGCFIICARFDLRLFGELLIRPLAPYEKPAHSESPDVTFYLEDGNHRALVYATLLKLREKTYHPVNVILSKDWCHIYPWAQPTSD